MKKKLFALAMSLIMVCGLAACGSDAGSEDVVTTESSEAAENTTSITEWYNSENRTLLESTINDTFSSMGMTFFVTISEPDTIIYNYQYAEQLDVTQEFTEQLSANLKTSGTTIAADIASYKENFQIPLEVIRTVYLNADGSEILSMDFREDYVPETTEDTASTTPIKTYENLQAWVESEDNAQVTTLLNEVLASSGVTCEFVADDSVLVMEYRFTEQLDSSEYSQEEIDAFFLQNLDNYTTMAETLFSTFESDYGITISGVRVAFYDADATLIYEQDLALN